DQRQFGRLLLGTEAEIIAARAFPARLGPEPIHGDLTEAVFAKLIHARRRPVKSALLDQSFLAGVGNIYADEACFRAGIRPSRWTHRLTVRERRALYEAIQHVLENSIAARGSSIINYVDGFGLRGGNPDALLVDAGAFGPLDLRMTHYLQGRGSTGQDIGLGIFAYLGSIEVTLLIAVLLGVGLFRGLRLLAVLPAVFILAGSGLEILGKQLIVSPAPGSALQRFPEFLPSLGHQIGRWSFPSGHLVRATLPYGLVADLAERWAR